MSNKVIVNTDNWPICTLNSFPSSMGKSAIKNNMLNDEGVL